MDVGTVAGLVVRPAVGSDNAALCRLFADVSMEADLDLEIRRDPDFFALYEIQGHEWECWVGDHGGELAGIGAIVARDGYLASAPARIGYLGDLRIAPELQGKQLLPRFYGPVLGAAAERFGCDVFLTTVIASNRRAIKALTGSRARAAGIPPYSLIRRFNIRALHLTIPLPRPRTPYVVTRGTVSEIDEIAAFLDSDGRTRPFGYAFPAAELRRRLRGWPDFEAESFFLARDEKGDLVGCAAVWDPHALKRSVVRGYGGRMRSVSRAYNAAAKVLRFAPLPAPGGVMRYAYATHVAVPSADARIMRALIHAIYADQRGTGRTSVAFCVYEDDPLAPAFRGFPFTDLRTNLYAVPAPGTVLSPACFASGRPGFEMALV